MSLRSSREIVDGGFSVIQFPRALSGWMLKHIQDYIAEHAKAGDVTAAVNSLSDDSFVSTFAKPRRIFPETISNSIETWVSSLDFNVRRSGINYVSAAERAANPALSPHSFDVFWRCVRNDKPDVARAHADFQFWEIARGTPLEPPHAFDCDERWKIWIPLSGCDGSNSLQVAPGSHQADVPFETVATPYGTKPSIPDAWIAENENRFMCPLSSFTDTCVLFHDKLVHRGPRNMSPDVRLSAEFTILLKL